jgi:hypothetical protein
MTNSIKIRFKQPQIFEISNIRPLFGLTGLYFIFTDKYKIKYPFGISKLLYIGMSEKKTNSMGNRLMGHYEGASGNPGLINYRKVDTLYFTYISFEMVRQFWKYRIEDLESYFILDFVKKFGVYPICNNKSGYEILEKQIDSEFTIDWQYFN